MNVHTFPQYVKKKVFSAVTYIFILFIFYFKAFLHMYFYLEAQNACVSDLTPIKAASEECWHYLSSGGETHILLVIGE